MSEAALQSAPILDLALPKVLSLGRCPYQEVWELQKDLQQKLISGEGEETIIVCEHNPVITIGRSGSTNNILVGSERLKSLGIDLFEVERGGDVTFHGPGQLVVYPILDLSTKRKDVVWYMRSLEEAILRTIARTGVIGQRLPGKTGVWTKDIENVNQFEPSAVEFKKIASIGVRISRWCTLHGLALNVSSELDGFSLINPCGYLGIKMTSLAQELGVELKCAEVEQDLVDELLNVFYRA